MTFFFAGHAGVKAGSFYLCSRDSDPDRFSTTAFPIIDLFTMINEFHPNQVNIVVDACESGGSSFDLNQLLKPEIVGSSEATRITFLGACSSDQLAGETPNGGNLTRELMKCLTGDHEIQTKWPFLDLIEIGGIVSKKVNEKYPEQKPITWALNFFGDGRFARNPHFGLGKPRPWRFNVWQNSKLRKLKAWKRAKNGQFPLDFRMVKIQLDDPLIEPSQLIPIA